MSSPVLVRGSEATVWNKVLRLVSALGVAGGIALVLKTEVAGLGLVVALLFAIVSVVNEVTVARNRRRRRWVADEGEGFAVVDSLGERQYRDEDVVALSYDVVEDYASGELKAVRRHFAVRVAAEPGPIEMANKVRVGQSDPLAEMIERILNGLCERSRAAVEQGAMVQGEGWTLDRQTLAITDPAAPQEVPLSELAECGVFEGKFCIWRRGDDRAFARLALESENLPVLQNLLGQMLAEREEEEADAAPPQRLALGAEPAGQSRLGRILFERRSRTTKVIVGVLAAAGLIAGVVLLLGAEMPGVGILVLGVGAALAVIAWRLRAAVFRCQERGVCQSGAATGERSIRYEEVDRFTYSAVRHFVNGVYSGTSISLRFDAGPQCITYNTSLKRADDDLDNLRDHISGVVAARMSSRLADGESVAWTPNLTFRPDGIEYRPAGLLGRKAPQFVAFPQVANFDIQQGVFHLWRVGAEKSVIREPVSAPNFFPGFYLLVHLFSEDEEEEAAGESQP